MSVVIIDYGSGNLHSAHKAVETAAASAPRGTRVKVSDQPEDVARADRLILPGVGAFRDCWEGLHAREGLAEALRDAVEGQGKPFLGICVGMQMMARRGLEHGETRGFGWIDGTVGPIRPQDPALKVPHMGWNTLQTVRHHPVLDAIPTGADGLHAYFVHSYAFDMQSGPELIATTGYGGPVAAIVGRDNVVGTQFHPEKSQALGLRLLANFLTWTP